MDVSRTTLPFVSGSVTYVFADIILKPHTRGRMSETKQRQKTERKRESSASGRAVLGFQFLCRVRPVSLLGSVAPHFAISSDKHHIQLRNAVPECPLLDR